MLLHYISTISTAGVALASAVVAAPSQPRDLLSQSANPPTWQTKVPVSVPPSASIATPLESLPKSSFPNFTYTHDHTQPPTLRRFTLRLSEVQGAPDGYSRSHFAVNGKMPGDAIHVNADDEVEVKVINDLGKEESASFHHHGLDMTDTVSGFARQLRALACSPAQQC